MLAANRAHKHLPLLIGIAATLVCALLNVIRNHGGLDPRHFELGGEYFHIATALKAGRGFADPFGADTGATGWMPPGFVWLLRTVCGLTETEPNTLYSALFIPALITLKCIAFGVGTALSWGIVKTWRAPRSYLFAFGASWITLVAWAHWEPVTASMHDGWWVALLVTLCLHGIVSLRTGRTPASLVVGLCLAALSSPVLYLATFLPLGIRALVLTRKSPRAGWRLGVRPVLPAALLSLACAGAWTLRVHSATGIWAPVKTNAGFELWQSLERTAHGVPTHSTFAFHPVNSPALRSEYAQRGEKAFVEHYRDLALKSLAEHPGKFVGHVLQRASNALIRMRHEKDTITLSGPLDRSVAEELIRARQLLPGLRRDEWRFLFVNQSDQERRRTLAPLSQSARDILITAWDRQDDLEASKPWWVAFGLREIALSGLVTLAWIIALRLAPPRLARRLLPALLLYAAILAPYILISHYNRYQELLIGLQLIAVTAAAGALLERWINAPPAPHDPTRSSPGPDLARIP